MEGDEAGWLFGLLVWRAMINDPERDWYFVRPSDDDEVLGMRYFPRQQSEVE